MRCTRQRRQHQLPALTARGVVMKDDDGRAIKLLYIKDRCNEMNKGHGRSPEGTAAIN